MPTQSHAPDAHRPGERHSPGAFVGAGLGSLHGPRRLEGCWVLGPDTPHPIELIESLVRREQRSGSGWALLLPYELGGWVEPSARSRHADPLGFPSAVLMRLGEPTEPTGAIPGKWSVGRLASSMGRHRYERGVRRVLEYIAAGDIYQANLAHHLHASFSGDPLGFAQQLISSTRPRYGAVLRFEHAGRSHTICSISPELFLRLDRETGVLETRPMKGTRPIEADASELESSDKDRAELNMITDLMRNDLGRVCRMGSVRVHDPRLIEPHDSGVLQASSVVRGRLRDGVGLGELIRATFPPGSVTGAPKVRAMQIIDELEDRPRHAYCGSIMHIDPAGNIECSVAIRTAHIWGDNDPDGTGGILNGQLVYPVGAGIVADSDPANEWAETLVKAGALGRSPGLGLDLEP